MHTTVNRIGGIERIIDSGEVNKTFIFKKIWIFK